jgi:hypothetical protein
LVAARQRDLLVARRLEPGDQRTPRVARSAEAFALRSEPDQNA